MYIRITSKCNMMCDHCGFSSSRKGAHMDLYTYHAALELAEALNTESIELGGGEPTIHPEFVRMLQEALWSFSYVWLATNGTKRKIMQRLASVMSGEGDPDGNDYEYLQLQHENQLCVALSTDHYHDTNRVDPYIRDLWRSRARAKDPCFQIYDSADRAVLNQGRAKRKGIGTEFGCVLPTLYVEPDGLIRTCSLKGAPTLGTVFDPQIPEGWDPNTCHKQQCNLVHEEDRLNFPVWENK